MGNTIDSLDIEISASVKNANRSLDALVSRLKKINGSLSSINGAGLSSLSLGVSRLSDSMVKLSANTKTADFTRLAKNLSSLSMVDTTKMSSLAVGVSSISKSLSQLSGMNSGIVELTNLGKAIKSLGYASSDKAIKNIPLLATELKKLMATLSTAPRVNSDVIKLTEALAKLASQGGKAGYAANSLKSALGTYSSSANKAKKSTMSLASAIGKLYASYWMLFRAFGWLKQAVEYAGALTEIQNVVDHVFGEASGTIQEFAEKANESFGMSELSVKKIASTFQSMGKAMEITDAQVRNSNATWKALNNELSNTDMGYDNAADSVADMSLNLTKLAADIASFRDMDVEEVGQKLAAGIYSNQTRAVASFGLSLTQANVQEWALRQGIEANMRTMSQAQKTMLNYQYVMAHLEVVQADFIRTANSWNNVLRILGQNFQNLGATIGRITINVFKPMMIAVNNLIIQFNNLAKAMENSLGKIFGWTFETSNATSEASESAEELSDGYASAAGNAKKLKEQLQGFDKLNNLSSNSDSSSSSGGGTSTDLSGESDESNSLSQSIKGYESDLDTLEKLGSKISEKMRTAMESIDWESIYQKASNFGSGLASFLNGLFKPDTFYQVGRTIANSLNTVMKTVLGFGSTFDFANFGIGIANGVNGFFDNFDFAELAQTINTWVSGIWTTISSCVTNIDWGKILSGLGTFISNLTPETVTTLIGVAALNKFGKSIATAIVKKIVVAMGGASILNTFGAGLGALFGGKAATSALTFMSASMKAITGIGSVIAGVTLAVTSFTQMWQNGWSIIGEILKDFGILLAAVGAVILGAPALVVGVVAGIVAAVSTIVILVKQHWTEITTACTNGFNAIKTIFTPLFTWFDEKVITPIKSAFTALTTTLGTIFKGCWIIIQAVWIVAKSWFDEKVVTPIKTVFNNLKTNVSEAFKNTYNNIKTTFSPIVAFFTDKIVTPIKNAFTTAGTAIKNCFTSVGTAIKKALSSAFNSVASGIESVINGIVGAINSLIGGFNTIVTAAAKIVGADWSGVSKLSTISIAKIPAYATGGYPTSADLFYANENGKPELVGTMNGKTAVASNTEITGISDSIYDTASQEMALLRQQNQLLAQILAKDNSLNADDVFNTVRRKNDEFIRINGYTALA